MNAKTIEAIVTHLLQAQEKIRPIPPLTQSYSEITIQDAYRIQFSLLEKKLKGGAQSIGWKAGVTSIRGDIIKVSFSRLGSLGLSFR
jgi:2-keto-4-pentenoate hydratase